MERHNPVYYGLCSLIWCAFCEEFIVVGGTYFSIKKQAFQSLHFLILQNVIYLHTFFIQRIFKEKNRQENRYLFHQLTNHSSWFKHLQYTLKFSSCIKHTFMSYNAIPIHHKLHVRDLMFLAKVCIITNKLPPKIVTHRCISKSQTLSSSILACNSLHSFRVLHFSTCSRNVLRSLGVIKGSWLR